MSDTIEILTMTPKEVQKLRLLLAKFQRIVHQEQPLAAMTVALVKSYVGYWFD